MDFETLDLTKTAYKVTEISKHKISHFNAFHTHWEHAHRQPVKRPMDVNNNLVQRLISSSTQMAAHRRGSKSTINTPTKKKSHSNITTKSTLKLIRCAVLSNLCSRNSLTDPNKHAVVIVLP